MNLSLENVFGTISTVMTIIGITPQVFKSARTKSTGDVSWLMLWNCFLCSLSWIVYGSLSNSFFVVTSNIFGLLTAIIALLQKKKYG